jgi:iron complex transport system ATP-binding protein
VTATLTPPVHAPPLAIDIVGVTAAYRDRLVLDDVTLAIAAGERVALLGPNGAGKSTLLGVASGTLAPREGRVVLAGDAVEGLDRLEVARRLAVVPGTASLPFATRVEEVVALGRLPHEDPFRGARPADRAAVAAAIDRVGIGHLLGRDARELSLGERQLVMIAVALAQAAPVMFLDEPTVHLDLRHQVSAMELLVDLNERDGTTIVAVLHDLAMAAHFFPRLVLLDHGRVVADGPASDVLAPGTILEVFGVDPAFVSWRPPAEGAPRPAGPG